MEKKQQDKIIEYHKLGMTAEAISDYLKIGIDSVKWIIAIAGKNELDGGKDEIK